MNSGTDGPSLRNRVVERRRMYGAMLVANPRNWRTHPVAQIEAVRSVLADIGQTGELIAYRSERMNGQLVLLDGHMRSADFPDQEWDVAITDLDDNEADQLLLVHDPIASMAAIDEAKLDALLESVPLDAAQNEAVRAAFDRAGNVIDEPYVPDIAEAEPESTASPAFTSREEVVCPDCGHEFFLPPEEPASAPVAESSD